MTDMTRTMRSPNSDLPSARWSVLVALLMAMLLAAPPSFAQLTGETRDVTKRGTAAAEFLSIPVGARATGMGNAFSATVDDATAMYWNPAGMTALPRATMAVEYAQWLVNIDFNYAAVVLPMRFGSVGVAVTALH